MNRRLDSWKAIAEYLGRDVATARRWEKTLGLPVRRVGGAGRSVFAYTDDIDAWLASPKAPSAGSVVDEPRVEDTAPPALAGTRGGRRWWVAALAVLAVLAAAAWRVVPGRAAAPFPPERAITSTRGVTALDGHGRELWHYSFPANTRTIYPGFANATLVVDGGDPSVYVVTSHRFRAPDDQPEGGELIALGPTGRVEHMFSFTDVVTVRGTPYGAPWELTSFAVTPAGTPPQIAVSAHHYTWSPSLITVLDKDWQRTGTFVNDGWIETLAWLAPERLALGGFLNERDAGLAIMLDTATMRPSRMATMPRSELNRVTASRFNRAVIQVVGDRVLVRTIEVPSETAIGAVDAIYEFTRDFEFVRASFSDRYWEMHRSLEMQGVLHHTQAQCPDRNGPREVFMWDPASGWHRQLTAP